MHDCYAHIVVIHTQYTNNNGGTMCILLYVHDIAEVNAGDGKQERKRRGEGGGGGRELRIWSRSSGHFQSSDTQTPYVSLHIVSH